jgi:hypothetical protein
MGTGCCVGLREHDEVRYIFCKMDGYPEHMGPVLNTRFARPENIAQLLASGDIWYLG